MALLTGCTEVIDHHHALSADMGERFLFYRYESSDGWSESYKALSVANPEELTTLLQACINEFACDLGLDWDTPPELPELDPHDRQRVIAMSQFAAHGRSAVVRDTYSREIIQVSTGEYPTRLALAVSQILRSLHFIGVNEDDSWRIVRKLAFDSLTGSRRITLLALLAGHGHTSTIAGHSHVSQPRYDARSKSLRSIRKSFGTATGEMLAASPDSFTSQPPSNSKRPMRECDRSDRAERGSGE